MIAGFVPFAPGRRTGHVVLPNGCWRWVGAMRENGYGALGFNGRVRQAHRIYYERARGPVPASLDLDHLCRNRWCVNPDHLEPVPRHVNAWRGVGTKLSVERVRAIRRSAAAGRSASSLGREFGVHAKTIIDIVNFVNWKHA